SDRCARGETEDLSGKVLVEKVESDDFSGCVVKQDIVPDEVDVIKKTLELWSDSGDVDLILTTGGTGFALRDVTPEATKLVITKEAPGMVIAMIKGSLEVTPMAMLSRPVCGVRGRTLIVNFPGSPKGAKENFDFIKKPLKHAVDLLRNTTSQVEALHRSMQGSSLKSQVNAVNVADRARTSQFSTIPVSAAQDIVIQNCLEIPSVVEKKTLKNGLGFILAEDILAKDPLPPFPASIKDGYAVFVTENSILENTLLQVRGDSTAGESPDKCRVEEGFCIRVSTGAPVPPGANAVVQIEDTLLIEKTEDGNDEKVIRVTKPVKKAQDIRPIGSDIPANELIMPKGTRLGASELGILATVGRPVFAAYRKPTIGLLSTGNELQSPHDIVLDKGKIRDSNKTTLESLFATEGFQTLDIGIAKDTPDAVYQKLVEGLNKADVLVCTGGVSMGEKDYLKRVLVTDLGATIHFGAVLMKPGKPTTFATCTLNGNKKLIFGLPGNPVSATVTSHLFVIPALRKLSGWDIPMYPIVKVQLEKDVKLDPARPEYHRVTLNWNTETGIPLASSTGNQISSRLLSCNTANALMLLPKAGDLPNGVATVGSIMTALLLPS
ncbi:Gephyrin, partial [Orchesella cincta]